MSFLKKLAPIAGALIGASFGNPALGSALGGGIGSLLAGADIEDALKNAAIAGAGAYALKGAGPQSTASASAAAAPITEAEAALKTLETGAAVAPTASQAAQSGIMAAIKENPLTAATLASTGIGLLASEEEEERELTELEKRQRETGERIPGYKGRNIVQEYDYSDFVKKFMQGGFIQGPGTGKSDSIKSGIYQNGMKVQEARLSDGEFVMTERAVRGLGNGDRGKGAAKMYEMMRKYEAMA